ncbi:hypothetical protein L9W92_17405 [Pelotomaculum terephthalicicum JT]|uniref:hypothetical protein n=1 Tax=Pelotomaculum terephthalicicum TaxID=206393 RepID=UPI0009D2F3A7|nr:hypothetical protein [Pelotomaculum terephthalicicum]MCG9969781.1 hypothetical protein [Pelotomaculum terephthalicicum JT]OPY62152.1 MAG: hypothetical protein A4E56_01497 [Pelotomaculum sp. PtaU1.Bin065]
MKKLFKLLPIIFALCLLFSSIPAYASTTDANIAQDQDLVLDLSKNPDGATVTFQKTSDGSYEYVPDNKLDTLDKTTEIVTFHVGLRNWIGSCGDLYWEATSNLPSITSVSCKMYVKSTSILFPATYASFNVSAPGLGGVTYATDVEYVTPIPENITAV